MRLGLGISIPGTSGLVQAAFSPLDLSPVLWLDASDTSTITEVGGAVSQWDDKSGNGNDVVQATAAAQPTTGVSTINGLNILTFAGDYFAANLAVDVSATTIFAVFRENVSVLGAGLVTLAPSSGNDYDSLNGTAVETSSSPGILTAVRNFVSPNGLSRITGTKPSPFDVYVGRFSSGGLVEAFSSSVTASTTTSSGVFGSSSQVVIGARYTAGAISATRLNGDIAEILLYDSTLSNNDLNAVGSYLSNKWGKTWTAK